MPAFSNKYRLEFHEKLKNESFDLLVIGGGITGAGIALDAVSRGLKVALVEQNDFSSGTSSKILDFLPLIGPSTSYGDETHFPFGTRCNFCDGS